MFYLGYLRQTGAIENDFMRTTSSPGDDQSDPNCPMVHQYKPERNRKSGVVLGRRPKIRVLLCKHSKFLKDHKTKYIKFNTWKTVAEKFNLEASRVEKRYTSICTAYGRYFKKSKSVQSGSGRNA